MQNPKNNLQRFITNVFNNRKEFIPAEKKPNFMLDLIQILMKNKKHYSIARHALAAVLFSILFFSCKNQEVQFHYELGGQLSNSNNEWLMVYRLTTDDLIPCDSVQLEDDGSFHVEFSGIQSPDLFLVQVKKFPWRITLALKDGEKATLNADALYLYQTYTISGSDESEKLQKLHRQIENYVSQADSLYLSYRNKAKDSITASLRKQYDSLLLNNYQQCYGFVKRFTLENSGSLSGLMALYSRYGEKMILDEQADFELFEVVAKHTKK